MSKGLLRLAGVGLLNAGAMAVMSSVSAQNTTPTASPAVSATAPSVERVGDWELLCQGTASAAGGSGCRIIQNHATADGKTALLVTIVTSTKVKGPVAVVSVPKGVYLAPGIELRIDGGQPFKLLYETCDDSGCHAGYRIAGEIAAAVKKGKAAVHTVFDSQQRPVTVSVSLAGLNKALDRLAELSK